MNALTALPEIFVRLANNSGVHSVVSDNPLSRKEQEQLRDIAKVSDYRPDTTLYAQGDEARHVYLIAHGIVRINHCSETGHRQILAFRVPGDFCGIPSEGHYFNCAETISKATLYRFEWRQLQQIFFHEPHLQSTLLDKILNDYRHAQLRISTLGQQNNCQRLASFIIDFMQIEALFDSASRCLTLPVNRFDLADYLGTGPESTARAFAKLEDLGLIRRITARKIRIIDKTALQMLNLTSRRRNFARMGGKHQESVSGQA